MTLTYSSSRWRPSRPRSERGEALPIAILFLGVFFTILVGVHVVLVALARTAVQGAADAALAAAQAAGHDPLEQTCPDSPDIDGTLRQCEGILAARIAMAGARRTIIETRAPIIAVEAERGVVTALVFGGAVTPVLGGVELTGRACGPLDDVPASALSGTDPWQC